jgi:hypothetical protein
MQALKPRRSGARLARKLTKLLLHRLKGVWLEEEEE